MKELSFLNKYLYKYRARFILGILFVAISNFFAIYPAQVIRAAFDHVAIILQGNTNVQVSNTDLFSSFITSLTQGFSLNQTLMIFGLLVLGLAILKGLFMFFMRQTIIVMSRLIEYDLKNEVYDQYQKLSMSFYKKNNTGDLMNRISEDVSRVRMYLGPAIMYTINLVVLFTLVIYTMVSVNPKLTLYVLLPLPILSITIYYVSNIINKKSEIVQKQLSDLSTFTQEAFSGIRVLKAYSRENFSSQNFENECNNYKTRNLDLVKVNALFHPFMILLIGLSTLLTVFIGGNQAIAGNISFGNIAEFIIYVNMLTWPVASLGWVTSLVQRAAASQKRINEFLNEEPEITDISHPNNPSNALIKFSNVGFKYTDSGITALNNISLVLNEGKSLGVIGKTGSGKSTLANLITRLYDASEGNVTIGKENIKTLGKKELRKMIGYIPQDVFLFSDTIYNNISFGLINCNKEQVITAAKDAAVIDDILKFPNGFETMLGERGITLSGGQKQRVAIARAIIKSPKILIFDDSLSAIDTETEERLLQNLNQLNGNTTKIIISHRISSVKDCDEIIVLNNGNISERGTHFNLIANNGIYHDLYNKQLLEKEAENQLKI